MSTTDSVARWQLTAFIGATWTLRWFRDAA
ncbi:hypothetical protein Y013_03540 [Rhodococcus pyridinivorans SB3094]|uniref:Uncharacterized protein n=1 Tax=Rhodococcus pyridinivorans SB3094 TaxID=1435356 RepID=V9XQF1_9NOCA|nr:hypothetical protein Y013_03540 [Rhodococcus pyridinivorans SB3094]